MTDLKLGAGAYEPPPEGREYSPLISADLSPPEATLRAVLAGIAFGIIFGAANAYLGLQAGLTISTSIPIAVMTVAAFRVFAKMGKKGGLLEANLAQTTGSASSSVASGLIFTLPALWLWGAPPSLLQMTLFGIAGGMLGILFMVPLRRFLIVREHGKLPYPEGTACAEVLVASEAGGARARGVFLGIGVGAALKLVTGALKVVPGALSVKVPFLPKAMLAAKTSPALLGVGYILGPRIATIMVGGGLLSAVVIIPAIAIFTPNEMLEVLDGAVATEIPVKDAAPSDIWNRFVRYIGAGAVAAAGIMTLIKSIPTMIASFRAGMEQYRAGVGGGPGLPRTQQDLPLKVVGIGVLSVVVALAVVPQGFDALDSVGGRALAAVLVAIFAFFFVTVSSRIVGLVGVTSNPTSGMTIATLLGTATVFLLLGWTDTSGKVAALTVGCIVAIAASIAGDTSQDLKTGFLLGATPRRQQMGELVGVLTATVFVSMAIIALGESPGFGTAELPAPQATLMRLVIDGVLERELPWHLVAIGAGIAVGIELCRLPSLPFAVGVYLPLSTMMTVFIGGMLRQIVERGAKSDAEATSRKEEGVLFGSGLVGGEGLLGVGLAMVVLKWPDAGGGIGVKLEGVGGQIGTAALLALLVWFFARVTTRAGKG
ncbi:MAG: oligopeptide transporter, OPT family [Planctomycetes bacterium]|nr:oligopeptide transporter, OPT family [Planctomycetota bacterium]